MTLYNCNTRLISQISSSDAASGTTVDYAHTVGSSYSYTPELRGDNFRPNETEIQPAFEETWAGIVALVKETESHIY